MTEMPEAVEAVFISDLHLHPDRPDLLAKWNAWLAWVVNKTKAVYILGDFFHVWAGDDTIAPWSQLILDQLASLSAQGIHVYFMPGNRDFLLGSVAAKQAKMTLLADPTVITLGGKRIVLAHGDAYCTQDKAHQWFRRITRHPLFLACFLKLPRRYRLHLVARARALSRGNQALPDMQVIPQALAVDIKQHNAEAIIHGHTHQPILQQQCVNELIFQHMILSDWDSPTVVLCYNKAKGFFYEFL